MRIVEIEFDGGCGTKKGKKVGTFGYVIRCDGKEIEGHGKIEHPEMTNNIAEYLALLKAIKRFKQYATDPTQYKLMIYGDSMIIVETVAKRWGWSKGKVVWNPHRTAPHLRTMLDKVHTELKGINYQTVWVRRDKNSRADALGRK